MILPNNPAIDVDELMKRVRSDAARIRVSGAIEDRRGEPRNANEMTLARALDRHRTVTALLNQAEKENAPRTTVPRRIAAVRVLQPVVKAALKVYNYAFKQQREFNLSLLRSGREMVFMQAIIGEAVARISEELRSMERYRTETFREIRATLGTLVDRLSGLEHSHHITRVSADSALARLEALGARVDALEATLGSVGGRTEFAHERIDSAEATTRALSAALEHQTAFVHERIDSGEATAQALSGRLDEMPTSAHIRLSIVDALRDVERRMAVGHESLLRNDAILRGELLAFRRRPETAGVGSDALPVPQASAREALHAAIGDRFRGERPDIMQRLEVYLPFIAAAGSVDAEHPLLDIGSGRGEWLELLRANGVAAVGVDTNELLVAEAGALSLNVRCEDGLAALRRAAAGSLGAATAFHVVEHLTFEGLCALLEEAQRALRPGGVLILETPDPRNILVSTRTFYLDPTHRNPIPVELLEFLTTSFGYVDVQTRALNAPQTPSFAADDVCAAALDKLFSHPQDYAVIAHSPQA